MWIKKNSMPTFYTWKAHFPRRVKLPERTRFEINAQKAFILVVESHGRGLFCKSAVGVIGDGHRNIFRLQSFPFACLQAYVGSLSRDSLYKETVTADYRVTYCHWHAFPSWRVLFQRFIPVTDGLRCFFTKTLRPLPPRAM